MSKRSKRKRPSRSERELWDALERLKSGRPRNTDLLRAAKQGKLRINYSTVAKEAGRSRTLIGVSNCRYPAVRSAIEAEIRPPAVTRTADEVIQRLRLENAKLKADVKEARSLSLALLRQRDSLERAVKSSERGKVVFLNPVSKK